METKHIREISKMAFTSSKDEKESWNAETIKLGCLLRIADSLEIVTKDYEYLKRQNKNLEESNKYLREENNSLHNSIKSYKGHITRLKKL